MPVKPKPMFVKTLLYHSYIFNLHYISLQFLSRWFNTAAVLLFSFAPLLLHLFALFCFNTLILLIQPESVVMTAPVSLTQERSTRNLQGISNPLWKICRILAMTVCNFAFNCYTETSRVKKLLIAFLGCYQSCWLHS